LLGVTLKLALEVLAGIWENVLKPALEKVWQFIKEKVIPIIEDLIAWVDEKLRPPLEWLAGVILENIKKGFQGVKDAIQWVIDKVIALINKLKELKLPDWLEFNSPTKLEMGLRGIAAAMDEVNRKQLNITAGGAGGAGATNDNRRIFYVSPMTVKGGERSMSDEIRFLELMS
jgi:hypothetical protein